MNDAPDETTQTNPAATDAGAENSQHDPAADADDEQEETSTQRPGPKEATKTKKSKRGTKKRGANTGLHPRQRISKTRKRTETPAPHRPQRHERAQTPQDARRWTDSETARPTAAPSHQPPDARRPNRHANKPAPTQTSDRQTDDVAQPATEIDAETNRPINSRDETGAAAESDANQHRREASPSPPRPSDPQPTNDANDTRRTRNTNQLIGT